MSLTLALAFLCIILARLMLFTYEFNFLSKRDLREAEFEEWYSELHEDTIALDRTTVSLHYRPSITYSTIGLGVLFLPVFLFGKGLPAERVLLVIALVIETEVGVLLFKWLLELYASTSPRIINLPARLAFMTTSNATMDRQTQWFFRRLYANSRLTIFFGRVLGINSLTVPFRKPHVAISFDNCPELLTSNIPNTIEACESAMEPRKNAAPPWNDRDVEIFSLSTNARKCPWPEERFSAKSKPILLNYNTEKLRFANSHSGLALRGNKLGNLDEARHYLNGLLAELYLNLVTYWLIATLGVLAFLMSFNDRGILHLFFCLVMVVVLFGKYFLATLSATADDLSLVTARFSIHFRTTTSTLLLVCCLP